MHARSAVPACHSGLPGTPICLPRLRARGRCYSSTEAPVPLRTFMDRASHVGPLACTEDTSPCPVTGYGFTKCCSLRPAGPLPRPAFPRHWPPPPRPARCARGLRHGSQILFQENKAQVPSLYSVQCTLLLARTHATPGHGLAERRPPPVLPPKSPARTVRPAPQHATHASEAVVFRHVLHALGVAHHLVQL